MLAAYTITIHVPAVSIMISAPMSVRWVWGRLLLVFDGGLKPRIILSINRVGDGYLGGRNVDAAKMTRRNFPERSRIRLKQKKSVFSTFQCDGRWLG